MLNPSVCIKAQKEIDRVVGSDRLPTFEDMKDLPYLEALIMEIQRWRGPAPQAVPHCVTEADVYKGKYYIPAGAIVFGNSYGISRDPKVFDRPEEFRPERYEAGKERDIIMQALGKGHTGFGHGRRICPGMHMAERSLFINLAYLFWAFDIMPVPDTPLPDP